MIILRCALDCVLFEINIRKCMCEVVLEKYSQKESE